MGIQKVQIPKQITGSDGKEVPTLSSYFLDPSILPVGETTAYNCHWFKGRVAFWIWCPIFIKYCPQAGASVVPLNRSFHNSIRWQLWLFYKNSRYCGHEPTSFTFHDIMWNPEAVDQASAIARIAVLDDEVLWIRNLFLEYMTLPVTKWMTVLLAWKGPNVAILHQLAGWALKEWCYIFRKLLCFLLLECYTVELCQPCKGAVSSPTILVPFHMSIVPKLRWLMTEADRHLDKSSHPPCSSYLFCNGCLVLLQHVPPWVMESHHWAP